MLEELLLLLFLFSTGDGQVIHMANVQEGGTVTSALVTSGIKSTKATIRIDDLKDVVGQNGQAEIANYLDGQSEYASLSLSLCLTLEAH